MPLPHTHLVASAAAAALLWLSALLSPGEGGTGLSTGQEGVPKPRGVLLAKVFRYAGPEAHEAAPHQPQSQLRGVGSQLGRGPARTDLKGPWGVTLRLAHPWGHSPSLTTHAGEGGCVHSHFPITLLSDPSLTPLGASTPELWTPTPAQPALRVKARDAVRIPRCPPPLEGSECV